MAYSTYFRFGVAEGQVNGETGKSRGKTTRTLMPWQGWNLCRRQGRRLGIILNKRMRFTKMMLLIV